MKRRILYSATIFTLILGTLSAQHRDHQDYHGSYTSSGHYDYDAYNGGVVYTSYHGSQVDRRSGNTRDYREGNRRYEDRIITRMTRRDRRCLQDLREKLYERERRAWTDGRLSRRERNRIIDVQRDIDRLFSKYDRDFIIDRNRRYRQERSSCR